MYYDSIYFAHRLLAGLSHGSYDFDQDSSFKISTMFRKFLTVAFATLFCVNAAAADFSGNQYWFRYKADYATSEENAEHNKDIRAFYVGAVGVDFSEKLPMKSEWEHDTWVLSKGRLPNGINFNSSTLAFEGTPSDNATDVEVELTGYSANGDKIASAVASFDILNLPNSTTKLDLYAHTGTYFFKQFAAPSGVVIDHWKQFYAAPKGINIIGRNFDGTPTEATNARYLIEGFDYLGNPLIAYYGNFIVEDAPSFPFIADKVWAVDKYVWLQETDIKVGKLNYALKTDADVRYYVDVKDDGPLPGSLQVTSNPYDRHIKGVVPDNWDQQTIRYRAIDIDGKGATSNWFKIGTAGPVPVCGPYNGDPPPADIIGWVDTPLSYFIPTKGQGKKQYVVTAGTLPDGVTLDQNTGYFIGTPTAAGKLSDVMVEVHTINGEHDDQITCGPYSFSINPPMAQAVGLTYSLAQADIRVGEAFNGRLVTTGKLVDPWKVEIDDQGKLPPGISFDPATLSLTGSSLVAGIHQPSFTLTNGDGQIARRTVTIGIHDPLSLASVPSPLSIRQYDLVDNLYQAAFPTEPVTPVIGNPHFEIIGGPLPDGTNGQGLQIDPSRGIISGGTTLPPENGPYGPFQIKLTDDHQGSVVSNPFYIDVLPRDAMESLSTNDLTLVVNYDNKDQQPFSVKQPPLAQGLPVAYALSGPQLPAGLVFDAATGSVSGKPVEKSETAGYRVQASDTAGGAATSDEFSITVVDPPLPAAADLAPITVNVGRDVASPSIQFNEITLVGGVDAVVYDDYEPKIDGLTFSQGILSGQPLEEFSGTVLLRFRDGAGRAGAAKLPLTVLPYPALTTDQSTYNVPRLADAKQFGPKVVANNGFYGGITWSLSTKSGRLPTGMKVNPDTGVIQGSTTDAKGVFKNIVIQARDKVTGLEIDGPPFVLNIVDRVPMTLTASSNTLTYLLEENTLNSAGKTPANFSLSVGGSVAGKVTYTLSSPPPGVTINTATGQLAGVPNTLGDWPVIVIASDSEGMTSNALQLKIKATYNGSPKVTPASQTFLVRQGETFKTAPLRVTNSVGYPTYTSVSVPASLSLNSSTGLLQGKLETPDLYEWVVGATDTDGRLSVPPAQFSATVIPPLALSLSTTSYTATQYSADDPIKIHFERADNAIGEVTYAINGTLPGKPYYRIGSAFVHYTDAGSEVVQSAADLPDDALVFDSESMTLTGVPSKSGTFGNLYLFASDDHQLQYLEDDPTRESFNTAMAGPFSINVASTPLSIASSQNPKGIVVPDGNADVVLSAVGDAYGKGVTWTAGASTLPSGITYKIEDGEVRFSGYWTNIGTYSIQFTATDTLGRTASINQTFKVLFATDPIVLNVADIVTKVGYAVKMELPFATASLSTSNTFGKLTFSSPDIGQHAGLTLNPTTGAVTGQLSATQAFTINLRVSDETNRITSKPVNISVIPNLRLVLPTQISLAQAEAANVATDTSYNIGKVTYRKGLGTWPAGLDVNSTTGKIVGSAAAPTGTYAGLTVVGRDEAGDEQSSNLFAINITKKLTTPSIANIANRTVTVDTVMTDIAPSVTNGASGDVYGLVGALPAGLNFNSATGRISGTPTETGIFKLVMRIRDINGDGNQTAEFRINVVPKDAMAFTSPVPGSSYSLQTGVATEPLPLSVKNAVGNVTYSIASNSVPVTLDTANKTLKIGPSTTAVTNGVVQVVATDELNRQSILSVGVTVAKFEVVTPGEITVEVGTSYSATPVTIKGASGAVTVAMSGLPSGLSVNGDTGVVSGTPTAAQGANQVTVTATDQKTGATATGSFTIFIRDSAGSRYRFWRMSVTTLNTGLTIRTNAQLFSYFGNAPATPTITNVGDTYISDPAGFASGGGYNALITLCKSAACNQSVAGSTFAWQMDFGPAGANLAAFNVWESGGGWMNDGQRLMAPQVAGLTTYTALPNVKMERSNDGQNWERVLVTGRDWYAECVGSGYCYRNTLYRLYY
ncbi:putative Ig domain-containing protein [Rhizobium sp. MHM7A]|uniref:putative Ig domain-containing protein n=1 Tax=Rhizobium sp. MHM7A TaxID=2583233 RepID=UPI001106B5B8|nr:putative Ig domain-containing protein [Rhizobium sp. MHM7A]TLX16354.1 hypothetical protein FFR93_03210 [Rhizobium sp. MHM7A]